MLRYGSEVMTHGFLGLIVEQVEMRSRLQLF